MIHTTGTPPHRDRVFCSRPLESAARNDVGNDRQTFRGHEEPGLLSAAA